MEDRDFSEEVHKLDCLDFQDLGRWGADSDLVRWALFVDVPSLFVGLKFHEGDIQWHERSEGSSRLYDY